MFLYFGFHTAGWTDFFCSVADVGFSFDLDTIFVDARKRCSSSCFHTSKPYLVHWRVLVLLGWILLGRGGVLVHVHAVVVR